MNLAAYVLNQRPISDFPLADHSDLQSCVVQATIGGVKTKQPSTPNLKPTTVKPWQVDMGQLARAMGVPTPAEGPFKPP